jgi:hypothetical protein
MDRQSVIASIERKQREWDRAEVEQRRACAKEHTQGTPKRKLHDLFREGQRRYEELHR